MSVVLAVLLCRLFVTCAGVPAGILSKGVCSTAVAVASLVSLPVSYMYARRQNEAPTFMLLRADFSLKHSTGVSASNRGGHQVMVLVESKRLMPGEQSPSSVDGGRRYGAEVRS